LLFLRDIRATIIAAISLPLSIFPAFWAMDILGFSLNLVSFLAITLSTGILVDDAIVEIENIVRHMRMGKSGFQAALDAADQIGLAVVAVIVALATLGLDIGPLLAGLGVVGIAIGFGAQSLVRDVISGIFFLMEDAFRVGEYIDTGRLRGTVEGMSLRSVRLRHQNGQVHTIPFGQVQSVTNFSRDWSVVKFNLHLEPTADIETVRKTIKRVGEELLDDPEIGAEFMQPLKMQGVVDVLQTDLVVRCKFTATPLRPTYLQRQALRRLIDAFAASQIRFAAPNVTVQLTSAAVG